jgi:hypothetical protein
MFLRRPSQLDPGRVPFIGPALRPGLHWFVPRSCSFGLEAAPNDLPVEEMADKYGSEVDTIYHFKNRSKDRIAAVLADWSDEFSDLWSVKKHNRIAELQDAYAGVMARLNELTEEAERATEEMRTVRPNAAKVLVPGNEWRGYTRERARLLREIAEEMGQIQSRNSTDGGPVRGSLTDFDVIAMDAARNFHAVQQ